MAHVLGRGGGRGPALPGPPRVEAQQVRVQNLGQAEGQGEQQGQPGSSSASQRAGTSKTLIRQWKQCDQFNL